MTGEPDVDAVHVEDVTAAKCFDHISLLQWFRTVLTLLPRRALLLIHRDALLRISMQKPYIDEPRTEARIGQPPLALTHDPIFVFRRLRDVLRVGSHRFCLSLLAHDGRFRQAGLRFLRIRVAMINR